MEVSKICLLALCLIFAKFSPGQNTLTFDSTLVMGGKKYQAEYSYIVEKGDTLFQGPFSLTQEIEEAEGKNLFSFSAISGNFKKNTPHGEWMLRQGSFRPSGKGAFKNYSYSFNINGSEFLAKGSFENGKKNNAWRIYEWEIANSAIQDTLFSASFPFKNDLIQGEFELFENGEHLKGRIDGDQFADGKWQFYATDSLGNKDVLKEWVFEENQLATKTSYSGGDTVILNFQRGIGPDSVLEKVELDAEILKILDLKAKLENPKRFKRYKGQYRMRELLFATLEKFHAVDTTFSPILGNKISPRIYIKIDRYPYSDEEKEQLKALKSKTEEADNALKKIKSDPQINLARISTRKVAYYISVLNAVEKDFLRPNREIVSLFSSGNLEYVNREQFLGTHLDESLAELDVSTVFNNDTTSETYTLQEINANNTNNRIENLGILADAILSEIQILRDSIAIYIEEIKREENLSELEGVLIEKYDYVKHLNDSLIGEQQTTLAGFDIKRSIAGFADGVLKDYSNIETTAEKMDEVEPTLECLQNLEELVMAVHKAPGNSYTIRDAYTKKVFNPYTSTEMEEKVKSSIYKSFEEVLLPAILENVKNLKCNNVKGFADNFDLLFEGMIETLKRDTGKQERKVKKTKTPSRASDILNFNLRF